MFGRVQLFILFTFLILLSSSVASVSGSQRHISVDNFHNYYFIVKLNIVCFDFSVMPTLTVHKET